MQNYYYRDKAGQEIGPLDLVTLSKFRTAGVLDGDTPVRAADSAEWKSCREIIADSPAPPAAQAPHKSSKKTFNWTWAGLAFAAVIIMLASRSKVEHAAEAEKCLRNLVDADALAGSKVINFKAINGESSFIEKNNFGIPERVECYKIKFTAKLELENDKQIGNIIDAHKGDWVEISSTMIGTKGENGWNFEPSRDVDMINASNPSLLSRLRQAKATSQANQCINNLRQIDAAINEWALETRKSNGAIPTWNDVKQYI